MSGFDWCVSSGVYLVNFVNFVRYYAAVALIPEFERKKPSKNHENIDYFS